MHKTIRAKFFLTFLMTTLLVVSGMYVFMRWSLNQGFTEFVETRQQEQVTNLIEELTEYYAGNQSWSNLATDKQKWIDLLWQSNPHGHHRPPLWAKQAQKEANNIWPPVIPDLPVKKRFIPLELRAMLLNSDKTIIFGRKEALLQLALQPVFFQEKIVGFLGLLPGKTINQVSEVRFMERQSEAFIWIALLMIFLSAGLAWLLAYTLGRPLKRITTAAKALAVGRYDSRLPVESNDELGQLARDFNDMAAALEQSEQARRRWVADISHELRTPLAILRGELEALQDGIRPLTAEAIDSLFGDVMRLNRLTEDLYQLSLSDQGALSYRKVHVDPVELLKEDLAALKPEFQNKKITIELTNKLAGSIRIYADPDRLSQLYRNLLNNSANYTDNNGQLAIIIFQEGDKLVLNFSDSSPGVPESELPKLFDRFYRLESSRNRHHGGAGLGLAICSNIVEAHNGTIQAQLSPLKGLTIRIELPISS
ncbi:ATP-binding protein [Methylobacter sp. S3L5C]|uniref:ATP-binding protein n=1 Tax=Methylobacter sp. S3L5C TaxID=2839024 RepID=UPI001FAC4875|nr:ATP-binding protein [Methylobacter sp. S3L5C]UOA10051.1 HAMP domain-containing protein [Methylobacter sp. S3L5C]